MVLGRLTVNRVSPSRSLSGFTLIEMMVVICVISIVSYFAVPGIKKAYEDHSYRGNAKMVDAIYNSLRSYYLIESEFPPDTDSRGKIPPEAIWCLPKDYYEQNLKTSEYQFVNKIEDKQLVQTEEGSNLEDVEIQFDVDNWFRYESNNSFFLNLRQNGDANNSNWKNYLRDTYPYAPIIVDRGIGLGYPEVTERFENEVPVFINNEVPKVYRNRYY